LVSDLSPVTAPAGTKAALFATCIVDQLYPKVGVSVVRVLRRLGVEIDFPMDQTCCGQPLYNSGFTRQARSLARRVLRSFKNSDYVVVPSGSCAAMIRVFYLDLLRDNAALLQQAQELSPRVYEFSEFLVKVLGVEDLGASYPGTAAYHPSCHLLRELEVREEPRRLLRHVRDLQLRELPQEETCCGFGGTFTVKFPHISQGMLDDKIANITATGADTLVSCDMSCLMHIAGALGRRGSEMNVRHLAQVLDQADGPPGAK
jgi:L-lactate dehydrogenase complex protein LldE